MVIMDRVDDWQEGFILKQKNKEIKTSIIIEALTTSKQKLDKYYKREGIDFTTIYDNRNYGLVVLKNTTVWIEYNFDELTLYVSKEKKLDKYIKVKIENGMYVIRQYDGEKSVGIQIRRYRFGASEMEELIGKVLDLNGIC